MSKWKTIRKSRLRRFRNYEQANSILFGAFVVSMLYAVGGDASVTMPMLIFVFYVAHWYNRRNRFTRIRKAIDDAGGENR